jgi:pyridoxine kinase
MMRVLSVQDLSCLGKCSLTVALPVLSSMGCAATALPTTLLSTHTAFPKPHRRSLTNDLLPICDHWKSIGAVFDTVSTGYLADPMQVEAVCAVLDAFPDALHIVDPAMGDHGRLYSSMTEDHVRAMKTLCARADVILPNVTEAALLTGLPYQETADPAYFRELLAGLAMLGAKNVILTGVSLEEGKLGCFGKDENGEFSFQDAKVDRQCHGTGDLFAAVVAGAMTRGKTAREAARLAAEFTRLVVENTPVSTPFGVKFEACLPWLWEHIK